MRKNISWTKKIALAVAAGAIMVASAVPAMAEKASTIDTLNGLKIIEKSTLEADDGLKNGCTSGDTTEHKWIAETVTVAANCQHPKLTLYHCSKCQMEVYVEVAGSEVATTAHVQGKLVDHKDAKHEEEGYDKYACSVCKTEYEVAIQKINHDLELVTTKEPTCTEDGTARYKCTGCDYKLAEFAVNKLGHDLKITVTAKAPDMAKGTVTDADEAAYQVVESTTLKCQRSGCDYEITLTSEQAVCAVTAHTYVELTRTEPTCIASGISYQYCTKCKHVEEVKLNPIAHEYVDGICKTCGKAEPKASSSTSTDSKDKDNDSTSATTATTSTGAVVGGGIAAAGILTLITLIVKYLGSILF
jgi:hypothetical protein